MVYADGLIIDADTLVEFKGKVDSDTTINCLVIHFENELKCLLLNMCVII